MKPPRTICGGGDRQALIVVAQAVHESIGDLARATQIRGGSVGE